MIDKMLRTEFTGSVFRERDVSVRASYNCVDNGPSINQPISFNEQKEYTLFLKVGCNFYANDVQLDTAKERAKKRLNHELYKDVLSYVYEAMGSTDNGDTLKILGELADKIKG